MVVVGFGDSFVSGGWVWDLLSQNSNVKTTTNNTSTIGWKTYENKDYGFSFKFPEDLEIEKNGLNINAGQIVSISHYPVIAGFGVSVKKESRSFNEVFRNKDPKKRKIEGIIYYYTETLGDEGITSRIYFSWKTNSFLMTVSGIDRDQILSTFKFTK